MAASDGAGAALAGADWTPDPHDAGAPPPWWVPRPEGAEPPAPGLKWCGNVGGWCAGHDCFCELTLYA